MTAQHSVSGRCSLLLLAWVLLAGLWASGGAQALMQPWCSVVDTALVGWNISSTPTATHKLCHLVCLDTPGCQSANYWYRTKVCELNSMSHLNVSGRHVAERAGSVYTFTQQDPRCNLHEDAGCHDNEPQVPRADEITDCSGLYNYGFTDSGLYNIYPNYPESTTPLPVWCDQETDGGGWIVFQRRQDGSEDFARTWDEYRQGFGDVSGEFWLGNDNLVLLTGGSGQAQLRVDVTDWADGTGFALYDIFQVQGRNYRLTVDGFEESSTAGDALEYHNGMDFTTIDRDNDRASGGNCAKWMRGGFWHNYCLTADPNGPYLQPVGEHGALSPGTDQGVTWTTYTGHGYPGREYSLKGTKMKLRKIPDISP